MAINPFNPSGVGSGGSLSIDDDGTNYDFKLDGVTLFSIRKSDKQLLLAAGVDTDQTL